MQGARPQDRADLLGNRGGSYAPTVSIAGIFMSCAMAACIRGKMDLSERQEYKLRQADVKAVFLNADDRHEVDSSTEEGFDRIIEIKGPEAATLRTFNAKEMTWVSGLSNTE